MTKRQKRINVFRRLEFVDDNISDENVDAEKRCVHKENTDNGSNKQIVTTNDEEIGFYDNDTVLCGGAPATTSNEPYLTREFSSVDKTNNNCIPNSGHPTTAMNTTTVMSDESRTTQTSVDDRLIRPTVKSLLARGFVVEDCIPLDGGGVDGDEQFVCLSLLEGMVYAVRATKDRESSVRLARVLATVGSHPHVVSYFSNWADAQFHFVQTELCAGNLLTRPSDRRDFKNAADYRTVLEHVSCALRYLHDVKKYAHNRVDRRNIYSVSDGDRVVYKLGGFREATAMSDDHRGAAAAVNDVASLCTTVSELMQEHEWDENRSGGDDNDLQSLRSFLSYVVTEIDLATKRSNDGGGGGGDDVTLLLTASGVNALGVWRWCCWARRRRPLLPDPMTVARGANDGEHIGSDDDDDDDDVI